MASTITHCNDVSSLYFLLLKKIKAVFEVRTASILGFMPDILSCHCCGEKNGDFFLDVCFEAPEDAIALGDESAIYRVLYNICENAVKFSYEGGRLSASVKAEAESVSVRIENDGKGMDPDSLSGVFEPFFRSGEKKGSGIGMYVAKSIVVAHGGNIFAESEEGKGASFTVILNRG